MRTQKEKPHRRRDTEGTQRNAFCANSALLSAQTFAAREDLYASKESKIRMKIRIRMRIKSQMKSKRRTGWDRRRSTHLLS